MFVNSDVYEKSNCDNICCIVTKSIVNSHRNDIFENSSIQKLVVELVIEYLPTDNPHSSNRS